MGIINWIKNRTYSILVILISYFPFAWNMFKYPYYENDEAVYLIRGYELATWGNLDHWTFWYDHAPGATYLMSLWYKIFPTFLFWGNFINSGRVLMLIFHILTALIIYKIVTKISSDKLVGIIAVIFFSYTPLGIYFQRRVLLDNMMMFTSLLSLYLVMRDKIKFHDIALSGLLMGASVLIKENAVFFVPATLYAVWVNGNKSTKYMNLFIWLSFSGIMVVTYPLMAILKGELFPSEDRVSLIGTLKFHASRGSDLPFWDKNGEFLRNLRTSWIIKDKFIVYAGFISSAIAMIFGLLNKNIRVISLAYLFTLLFFLRGGLILDFYILALIPFFAMFLSLCIYYLTKFLPAIAKNIILIISSILIVVLYLNFGRTIQYTKDENLNLRSAVAWTEENLDKDSIVMTDSFLLPELWYKKKSYKNFECFWKIQSDPQVYKEKNISNIEYLITSHEMLRLVRDSQGLGTIADILNNSQIIADFKTNSDSFIDYNIYQTTNGDWVEIRKLLKDPTSLDYGWKQYTDNYITYDGRVIDKSRNITTSEGQSYLMMRAALLNDKYFFDKAWNFTRDNLKNENGLYAWYWGYDGLEVQDVRGTKTVGKVNDANNAVDADLDIALALLIANAKFGDVEYKNEATELINSIKDHNLIDQDGMLFLAHAAGDINPDRILLNPSYFSPAHYRIFAKVTNDDTWLRLIDDTYKILGMISDEDTGLVPDWIAYDRKTGEFIDARIHKEDLSVQYGFDAFRINYRIGLDYYLFNSPQAKEVLSKINDFYQEQLEKFEKIDSVYNTDGTRVTYWHAPSANALALFNFYVLNADNEEIIRDQTLGNLKTLQDWKGYDAYYDQNWLWFADALVRGKFQVISEL